MKERNEVCEVIFLNYIPRTCLTLLLTVKDLILVGL